MTFAINGKFITQKKTGVQRFSEEIVKALDKISTQHKIVLIVPKGSKCQLTLKNIQILEVGKWKGILWEQICFPYFLLKNHYIGINLGNVAPLLKSDIVCIHDMNVITNPKWFNWKYVLWSRLQYEISIRRAKKILTVSKFTKQEMEKLFPKSKEKIEIISEGWQHMKNIAVIENDSVLKKFGLQQKEFIFSNYQMMPNKNFKWIVNNAEKNQDKLFVVSGWLNKKVNKSDDFLNKAKEMPNVKLLGYISDEEMKNLLMCCKIFVFPSFYEGFGIPPLEALSVGAKVVVSDIPVMHEIFGDSVCYIDPNNSNVNLYDIEFSNKANDCLRQYSWENAARKIIHILNELYDF